MGADAHALLLEVLALPHEERAGIAARLIASLDEQDMDHPDSIPDLWREEIERRARRATTGETDGDDWDSLRRRLTDELTGG